MLAVASANTLVSCRSSWAKAKEKEKEKEQKLEEYVDDAAALLWPILSNLGFSGVCGLAAAAALKVRLCNQSAGHLGLPSTCCGS